MMVINSKPPLPSSIPDDPKVVPYEAGGPSNGAGEKGEEMESDLTANGLGEGSRLERAGPRRQTGQQAGTPQLVTS